MNSDEIAQFKEVLIEEKERILINSKNSLQNDLEISIDDLPDETDLASVESSQHLVFRLRDRERGLLSKIEDALDKINNGDFGICEECEEPIHKKRLKARPVSTLCISCKEAEERREKLYA